MYRKETVWEARLQITQRRPVAMKEFPLRSVCKICVGGLRGKDAPAQTLACATGRLLLGKGRKTLWVQFSFPSSTLSFAKTPEECVFGFPWCWTSLDPGAKHKARDWDYLQRERMACLESGTHAGHSLNTTLQTEKRGTESVQIWLKASLEKKILSLLLTLPLAEQGFWGKSLLYRLSDSDCTGEEPLWCSWSDLAACLPH